MIMAVNKDIDDLITSCHLAVLDQRGASKLASRRSLKLRPTWMRCSARQVLLVRGNMPLQANISMPAVRQQRSTAWLGESDPGRTAAPLTAYNAEPTPSSL